MPAAGVSFGTSQVGLTQVLTFVHYISAKILIFYLFYYGFLAGLFAVSVTIVRGTLDDYTPTYQTRLQTPGSLHSWWCINVLQFLILYCLSGVGVQPKIPSNVEQSGNIIYTIPKPGEDTTQNVGYSRLVNQITTFLKRKFLLLLLQLFFWLNFIQLSTYSSAYNPANQTADNNFRNCGETEPMQLEQQFNPGEVATSCSFDKSQLGPCANYPYGYDEGKPCLYIKLNRVSAREHSYFCCFDWNQTVLDHQLVPSWLHNCSYWETWWFFSSCIVRNLDCIQPALPALPDVYSMLWLCKKWSCCPVSDTMISGFLF